MSLASRAPKSEDPIRKRKTQNICIILRVIHEGLYKGRQEDGPGPGLEKVGRYKWALNQHASIFRTLFSPKLISYHVDLLELKLSPTCLNVHVWNIIQVTNHQNI